MSTGFECLFFNRAGKHYYLLQDWSCHAGAWDWREHATCYGPFGDHEKGYQHLCDNHANPGGYTTEEEPTDDEVLIQAVEGCIKPNKHSSRFF